MSIHYFCKCCDKEFFSLRSVRKHILTNDSIVWGAHKDSSKYIYAIEDVVSVPLYSCTCCDVVWNVIDLVDNCCPITLLPVEVFYE